MTAVSTLGDARTSLAEEWKRRSPQTEQEIAAFYRESECLGADLEAWHAIPERQAWTDTIVRVARLNGVQSVLDVGAGGGHDLAALRWSIGDDLDLSAVEPNYLAGSSQNYIGTVIHRYETLNDVEEPTQFDLVLCIDVLEHVPDPEVLLKEIAQRVKVGGILIVATATHDQGTPLHLPELEGWTEEHSLHRMSFELVEAIDRMGVWQKRTPVPGTVIVVAHREVSVPTAQCLFELVGHGWPIAMQYGDADVGRARSKAASQWFKDEPTDVFLMIDDDIVFRAQDVEKVISLAQEKRSIAAGAYAVADGGHMASRGFPGQAIHYHVGAEPVRIKWPAGGFMAVHRDVVERMVETLPLCYPGAPDAFWPMFQEFVHEGHYLSEDYAFGQRALELGFDTWLDPSIQLIHLKTVPVHLATMRGASKEMPK